MFNDKGLPHLANWSCTGRTSKLPPRSPLQISSSLCTDCGSSPPNGKKHLSSPKEVHRHHQRTSSDTFAFDEQPLWLDELLNEPETPVAKATHRRSSSDSLTYLDFPGLSSMAETFTSHEGNLVGPSVIGWQSTGNSFRNKSFFHSPVEWLGPGKASEKAGQCNLNGVVDRRDFSSKSTASDAAPDQKVLSEKNDPKNGHAVSEADPKHSKQHFAQRSRVRKLQYIAELERNVSLLHVEGSDAAAELAFLKKQHLILTLENKALLQRIKSVAHEKQIKDAQYELLRKEVERLRCMYTNQQQDRFKFQSVGSCVNSTKGAGENLNLQFGCLSLSSTNHKAADSVKDPIGMKSAASYPCMMLQKS
ncbi:hypothetical protein H6P81_005036 [Aristolochia fimbriata]|uniref:BZIP domain-containing protein n=1 Tax=Aristolochia fimbriata TaxID=158543 RepID=A0AAV7EWW2_ARIFI|nr:hypothetical protein H6P81_005036 [Aristolochia fimbriata]